MCLHGCGKQAPPQSRSATPDPELADADLKFVSRLLREIALQDFSVVLYSLDPGVAIVDQKKERLTFHDHLVLGAAEIRGSTAKSNLLTSLLVNIPEKHPDYAINCFFPRHGIRVVSGGATNDFVICFECEQLRVYGAVFNDAIPLYRTGRGAFDQELKDHQLPMATKTNP